MTTRFWLFEGCAQTLFRWKIMDLPVVDALQTGVQHQRASNQKSIARVRKYLTDHGTRFQLALARLRLRLTSLATSILGQKNHRGASDSAFDAQAGARVPLMVRLARGDVSGGRHGSCLAYCKPCAMAQPSHRDWARWSRDS